MRTESESIEFLGDGRWSNVEDEGHHLILGVADLMPDGKLFSEYRFGSGPGGYRSGRVCYCTNLAGSRFSFIRVLVCDLGESRPKH
jgi:hypothetical protein